MVNEAKFQVPEGMKREDVAKTFTAYLIGAKTFDNPRNQTGDYVHGPWNNQAPRNDDSWQLDGTNDFFLHFLDDGTAMLRARYERDAEIVRLAAELFKARYC